MLYQLLSRLGSGGSGPRLLSGSCGRGLAEAWSLAVQKLWWRGSTREREMGRKITSCFAFSKSYAIWLTYWNPTYFLTWLTSSQRNNKLNLKRTDSKLMIKLKITWSCFLMLSHFVCYPFYSCACRSCPHNNCTLELFSRHKALLLLLISSITANWITVFFYSVFLLPCNILS